jgi:ankyrin repeat protein
MRAAIGILCAVSAAHSAHGAAVPAVREAAARAVARLQASQKDWFDQEVCTSCHHQFLPALAYREAREHGIPVDEKIARADAAQAFRNFTKVDGERLESALEQARMVDVAIGGSYSLLAADAAGVRSNVTAGVRPNLITAAYARFIAGRQKRDGHWVSFDERPPQSYSVFTATAVSLRAIDLYSDSRQRADTQTRIGRARAWLESHTAPDTEGRTFQLRGLVWSKADHAALDRFLRALERTQQADGGWGSIEGRPSDAYSTGQALVALNEAGVPVSDPRWQRGIAFLLRTQQSDGTWRVPTRLNPPAPLSPDYFESSYPYGHDQFISAMGASWAVMALARDLGPARAVEMPPLEPPAGGERSAGIEPWAGTLLFGSAEDLRRMLDQGFDPNSATRVGHLTPLMMAAPDASKMKLLLDRGAHIDERSKNGYTALMMAALSTDSTPAIRLLLSRGAHVHPAAGSDPPLYNAYPAALAALAGNAESVRLLRQAGDAVDDVINYAGLDPAAPLLLIASMEGTPAEIDVARALLDGGASVNRPDLEGLTPLFWAVLANKVDMARLLLDRGADVNHVDKHGMTPLLYAASIDYGDTRMVDLLLKHGARTDARTPEGLTALDLARKYRHKHLIGSLESTARGRSGPIEVQKRPSIRPKN